MKAGVKTCEAESGRREGKAIANFRAIFQFSKRVIHCLGSEINGADQDVALLANFGKNLYWGLAIEIDTEIHDSTAVFQAERSGITPSPRQIESHGRTGPEDLVVDQRILGSDGSAEIDDAFRKRSEGLALRIGSVQLT